MILNSLQSVNDKISSVMIWINSVSLTRSPSVSRAPNKTMQAVMIPILESVIIVFMRMIPFVWCECCDCLCFLLR